MGNRFLSLMAGGLLLPGCFGQAAFAQEQSAAASPVVVAQRAVAQDGIAQSGSISSSSGEVDEITAEIIRKQLDLQKLNTSLKLHQLPRVWATRSWALVNLANVSLTATGAYLNGISRYRYLHDPAKAPKAVFEHAAWLRVTANMITLGSSIFESSWLAMGDYMDHRRGLDLRAMRGFVSHLRTDIDSLLVQRAAVLAVANVSPDERQLYESEGVLLKDVRNLSLNEFARFYCDAKANKAAMFVAYFMAGTINALAASGGITGNAAAALKHHTAHYKIRLGGYGGIADSIAGSMNQSVPLVLALSAKHARLRSRKSICQELDCQEPAQLDAFHDHQTQFHQLVASKRQPGVHGAVLYDGVFQEEAAIFDEHEKLRLGDQRAARRRLADQLIFSAGIGAPKAINGIGITVGAYKYTNNDHERFTAFGAPAIVYGIGYSLAAAELLRYQTTNEIHNYKAKKAGTDQGQVLKREIAQLDQLTNNLQKNRRVGMFTLPKLETNLLDSIEPQRHASETSTANVPIAAVEQ